MHSVLFATTAVVHDNCNCFSCISCSADADLSADLHRHVVFDLLVANASLPTQEHAHQSSTLPQHSCTGLLASQQYGFERILRFRASAQALVDVRPRQQEQQLTVLQQDQLMRIKDIEASCLQTQFIWDDLAMANCVYKRVCVFRIADGHEVVSKLCKLQLLSGQRSGPCKLAQ